ncbi:OsmC family peroxiredoxin [Haloferax mediterranei ATCC 33500]|uniref:OsmC family peroxiredoxin n=1 Tax=Haloferax mediterranei (strain ATCC 33500 / DSM 1411 / JCM 8866 / NBRC 14739 / NCIMB 2177 / R-4) TaxID=523841 RepID=I3R4D6_HALMT|nr:OsmC family protein [Haloferax mediterranei]AFK19096.1 OsmC family protein [Haloferax mediterranei ATCC 33500]AHZ21543.1 OsmC family protein [Haloferax mediterranei ATCC 33500]EMA04004.1 OsmC family protein [Haloferax mediterranei ATCC 33500]MDX5989189.1 OsmC family protein [Haloferax mediterranei ATCC 33500]QCQ75570.1 OsmC family peroxiredoxin [Haloferax mediterranei ATCC 33500]
MSTERTHTKTTSVEGSRVDASKMQFETSGGNQFDIGGDGTPGEYMLGSIAGCYNVVGHLVAEEMGFELADLTISVAGDVDPRVYKGDNTDARAGYQEIRVVLDIDADVNDQTVAEWVERVEERCPVCDNIFESTPSITAVSNRES